MIPDHGIAALQLAVAAGMAVRVGVLDNALPLWDGRTFQYDPAIEDGYTIPHDLAHYLISPPERRTQPNYGLGTDYITGAITLGEGRTVTNTTAAEEEKLADLLGIAIQRHIGGPWLREAEVDGWEYAAEGGWEYAEDGEVFWRLPKVLAVEELLIARGLMTAHTRDGGIPTICSKA